MRIVGIDLAWGERKPDGVCVLEISSSGSLVIALGLTRGDDELISFVTRHTGLGAALLAIDAPLVCPNLTGGRPVDRLTHVRFGRFYAGCHPANRTRCPRPPRIAALLIDRGFRLGWQFGENVEKLVAEVYPHPAMVRLFELEKRIPYKRGTVHQRRLEFSRLQLLLRDCLTKHFPALKLDPGTEALLGAIWTKNTEDQTDAFFCALIAYWHYMHCGRRTEVLGDLETGFIIVPQPSAQ